MVFKGCAKNSKVDFGKLTWMKSEDRASITINIYSYQETLYVSITILSYRDRSVCLRKQITCSSVAQLKLPLTFKSGNEQSVDGSIAGNPKLYFILDLYKAEQM